MWELLSEARTALKNKEEKEKSLKAPAHVHSAHAAFQLLEHRMHSHNPPTLCAGLMLFAAFCFMYTGE